MREAQTHDYTARYWDHDYYIHKVILGGKRLEASGWGDGIQEGDYLILPNNGGKTRYQVAKIKYMRDPRDQWFADLTFAPRSEVES